MSALCHGCGTQIDEDEDVLCGNCKHDDAIRRECADRAVEWVNRNLCDMHMPLMCKRLEEDELRSFILGTEPAREVDRLKCDLCGNIETPPYAEGDTCYCGGKFKPAREESE